MPWGITITKAENGYVLSYDEELEDNRTVMKYIVVEDPSDDDETKTTQKMLNEIMIYFNLWGSKHDPVRVKVVRRDNEEKELSD